MAAVFPGEMEVDFHAPGHTGTEEDTELWWSLWPPTHTYTNALHLLSK